MIKEKKLPYNILSRIDSLTKIIGGNEYVIAFYLFGSGTTNSLKPLSDLDFAILLDKSLIRPNGIALSPDESKIYVSDSRAKKIFVWDILDDRTIGKKSLLIEMEGKGSADGLKVSKSGTIYSTGPKGIWVINVDGSVDAIINVPGQITNCNWGNSEQSILFVTSAKALYKITNLKDR